MVQVEIPINLLNPHGSDETTRVDELKDFIYELLNPHGSDETNTIQSYCYHTTNLFLTHTVQMKLEITTSKSI